MIRKAILFIILLSCGTVEAPDYITHSGINVYCEDLSTCFIEAELNIVVDSFIDNSTNSKDISDYLEYNFTDMIIYPKEFYCPESTSPTDWCLGLYDHNIKVIKVSYMDCIISSAVAHELAHLMQLEIYNMWDYEGNLHDDIVFFPDSCDNQVCRSMSVLEIVKEDLLTKLCNEPEGL